MAYEIAFENQALQDFQYWAAHNNKILQKILKIIESISRTPSQDIGKPEPLKYEDGKVWSRRINQEHRLVYKITKDEIIILKCRFHYIN